jgi:hypothetical protein
MVWFGGGRGSCVHVELVVPAGSLGGWQGMEQRKTGKCKATKLSSENGLKSLGNNILCISEKNLLSKQR